MIDLLQLPPDVCYSGGSKGADKLFGECAEAAGHEVVHGGFGNHFSPCKKETIRQLPYVELVKADPHLKKCNERLQRTFPTRSEYVNNLLRRNYFQIIYSDRIYAATAMNDDYVPFGGTAWAILMGIDRGIKEVYVFDWGKDKWFFYNGYTWNEIELKDIPHPYGKYAGIGSSELPENGQQAIRDLYGKTSQPSI